MGKKEDIFSAAYDLFSTKGFKSVGVSDITSLAGISVGSFYNYYASKEELFIDICTAENKKAKDFIIHSLDTSSAPIDMIQQFFLLNMKTIKESRILSEWYGENMGEKLRKQFQSQTLPSILTLQEFIHQQMALWRSQNILREDISDEEILSIYYALVYLDVHTDRMTSANFAKAIEWLSKFTAAGIMK